METITWKDGRLDLGGGQVLDVAVRGAGRATFAKGALVLQGTLAASAEDATIELEVRHALALGDLAHVWIPQLTPEPGMVAGDAVFRAPAVILASHAIAVALVVDVDDVAAARAGDWRAWLDYDHEARTIVFAAGDYRTEGHVFYRRTPPRANGQSAALRVHVIASREAGDLENPYGMVARWLWERWGRRSRPPAGSLEPLLAHVVHWAFESGWSESVWQEVELEGHERRLGAPVFIVDVARHPSVPPAERTWREPRSIWNQAWFSTQRCANGLLRYARQTGSASLEARARQMTEVALAAPQTDGLFPAVLLAGGDDGGRRARWRWTNSDRRPPSASADACHLVDAAFTSCMLLGWERLTGDPRAGAYVERFADRLARLQRPSGAFPGWVEPDGAVPAELAEGPETAVAATLLFELGRLEPALAALRFLEGVVRDARWEDFETYYSCAREPWGGASDLLGRRCPRNGVFKQNTLSIAWCARAFLEGFRAMREPRHLRLARRCLDELSLYQAVWDPPFLPAPAYGGFGVMNADSEWNDARQSLFAPLYLELGRMTGDAELTERGVAATRASFSMLYCPENAALARAYEARFPFFGPESYGFMMENQGHGAAEPIGTFTIFAWGNGSALAAAAEARDLFPEVLTACGLLRGLP